MSSLGRRLMDGEKEVKIHGQMVKVRANISNISSYSSHADQTQLKNFVARLKKPIKKIFVTMGEEEGSKIFARIIRDELGMQATVPKIGDVVELD